MVRGENMIIVSNEKGFSLIELMMAMVLTVGLMGAVFALMNQNQSVFVAESGGTDMNQNIRTAVDVMTRDIQSAGMGLSQANGSFSAIFYTNGTSGAPDTILIVNGDPFAPWADVEERDDVTNEFTCGLPNEVDESGGGFIYHDRNNNVQQIYQSYADVPDTYICYDDIRFRLLQLTSDGQLVDGNLKLVYNPGQYTNLASTFGSAIDTDEPDYEDARIAKLGGIIAYRVNQTTKELERSEDLTTWQAVARGITDLQIEYRVIFRLEDGTIDEEVTSTPTERKNIRAVSVKIRAESPDLSAGDKAYRQIVQKFEVAPRNFNLLRNNNLSSDTIE